MSSPASEIPAANGPGTESYGQIHCQGKIVRREAKKWRFEVAAMIEDYEFGTHNVLFL